MNSHTDPVEAPPANAGTQRRRLFTVCFLTITGIAMLGWWAALGWVAMVLVGWSLF